MTLNKQSKSRKTLQPQTCLRLLQMFNLSQDLQQRKHNACHHPILQGTQLATSNPQTCPIASSLTQGTGTPQVRQCASMTSHKHARHAVLICNLHGVGVHASRSSYVHKAHSAAECTSACYAPHLGVTLLVWM